MFITALHDTMTAQIKGKWKKNPILLTAYNINFDSKHIHRIAISWVLSAAKLVSLKVCKSATLNK